ncbi:CPBP family intramembrane glutamic endopeptidase [Mongoliitalea lutea]|nr:type II CAAX endopeptidase family protein [Mongoliitalea lutea]
MGTVKVVWRNLILAPIWFLIALISIISYFIIQGMDESDISEQIITKIPVILLIAQLLMLIYLLISTRKIGFDVVKDGWKAEKRKIPIDIIGGIVTGVILAITYIYYLSPLQQFLQHRFGDYVPAGETMTSLGMHSMAFFIANVLLAPFVEESLYRNFAMREFLKQYGPVQSIVLTSVMFGLMHWLGGFWYIILTGLLVGVPLAMITIQRGNLIWAFTAHVVLNSIEFSHISSL